MHRRTQKWVNKCVRARESECVSVCFCVCLSTYIFVYLYGIRVCLGQNCRSPFQLLFYRQRLICHFIGVKRIHARPRCTKQGNTCSPNSLSNRTGWQLMFGNEATMFPVNGDVVPATLSLSHLSPIRLPLSLSLLGISLFFVLTWYSLKLHCKHLRCA